MNLASRKSLVALLAAGALATGSLTACGNLGNSDGGSSTQQRPDCDDGDLLEGDPDCRHLSDRERKDRLKKIRDAKATAEAKARKAQEEARKKSVTTPRTAPRGTAPKTTSTKSTSGSKPSRRR